MEVARLQKTHDSAEPLSPSASSAATAADAGALQHKLDKAQKQANKLAQIVADLETKYAEAKSQQAVAVERITALEVERDALVAKLVPRQVFIYLYFLYFYMR